MSKRLKFCIKMLPNYKQDVQQNCSLGLQKEGLKFCCYVIFYHQIPIL